MDLKKLCELLGFKFTTYPRQVKDYIAYQTVLTMDGDYYMTAASSENSMAERIEAILADFLKANPYLTNDDLARLLINKEFKFIKEKLCAE